MHLHSATTGAPPQVCFLEPAHAQLGRGCRLRHLSSLDCHRGWCSISNKRWRLVEQFWIIALYKFQMRACWAVRVQASSTFISESVQSWRSGGQWASAEIGHFRNWFQINVPEGSILFEQDQLFDFETQLHLKFRWLSFHSTCHSHFTRNLNGAQWADLSKYFECQPCTHFLSLSLVNHIYSVLLARSMDQHTPITYHLSPCGCP